MATHRRLVPSTNVSDFYPTPPWATLALLQAQAFVGDVLEPCCGDGAMAKVLRGVGLVVAASDLHDRGFGEVRDFFDVAEPCDNVITNPPFNVAEDVLHHALKLARRKVALLLRTAFLEGRGRWERVYSRTPPSHVLVFSERLSMFPSGDDRTTGGTTSYAWFTWDRDAADGRTIVEWVPPGMRDAG
jgi:hypothetical protein